MHDVRSRNAARRSTMDILRAALEEEARLAPALLEEQQKAMKEAVDALTAASLDMTVYAVIIINNMRTARREAALLS